MEAKAEAEAEAEAEARKSRSVTSATVGAFAVVFEAATTSMTSKEAIWSVEIRGEISKSMTREIAILSVLITNFGVDTKLLNQLVGF